MPAESIRVEASRKPPHVADANAENCHVASTTAQIEREFSKLAVVIPAYNEEQGIRATLEALRAALPAAQIIVVNDGSSDCTGERARQVAGVIVVSHARNQGYGAALKTGIRHTRREFIAWYDADGQHRPEDLARVAAPVLAGEQDVVIGARGHDSAVQRERVAGKAILRFVAQAISRERIQDLNSGLRCFRRGALLPYLHLLPDGFSASSTSTLLVLKRGFRVGYERIVARERVGHSTVKIVRDGLRTLHLIVRIIVLFEAFRVFAALGLMLLVPGLVYGVAIAFSRGDGFPTLAGTAVISGMLTLFMGILADQIVEMRKERWEPIDREEPSERDG